MRLFQRLFCKELTNPPRTNSNKRRNHVPRIWNLLFGKYLLITNTFSSGILMATGDFASQKFENRKLGNKIHNWKRTMQMFCVGAAQGPMHHYFYRWMDMIMPIVNMKNVGKKILLDQLVMSPACIVTFFYFAGIIEGQSLRTTTSELKDKATTVYTADWLVWPPVQFINFYYLPTKYRVGYINLMTMLYNVFLSYIKHRETKTKSQKQHSKISF